MKHYSLGAVVLMLGCLVACQGNEHTIPAPPIPVAQISSVPHTAPPPPSSVTLTVRASAPPVIASQTQVRTPSPLLAMRIRQAHILVFDDSYGSTNEYQRLAQETSITAAIEGLGFEKDNVVFVQDGTGKFLQQLRSDTKWDLIIAATQFRDTLRGEIWQAVDRHVAEGSALVARVWYLDTYSDDAIQPLLQRCGVTFQKDLERLEGSNPNDYLIYYLQPDSPVFHTPNLVGDKRGFLIPSPHIAWVDEVSSKGTLVATAHFGLPTRFPFIWVDDVGDLLKIEEGSGARLLGGTHIKLKDTYGTIAECLNGRMILQTFRNYDYKHEDMVNLWQNYIVYTLSHRFEPLNEKGR